MPLTDEERTQLEELQRKADEPDAPASNSSRVENINMTIDLSDEVQVKRAVKAGYLPKSYLEDDDDDDPDDPDADPDPEPRRRLRGDYS